MKSTVFSKGVEVTRQGLQLQKGDRVPTFRVVSRDFKRANLDEIAKDKSVIIIISFDSIANESTAKELIALDYDIDELYGEDVAFVGISRDVPLSLNQFVVEKEIKRIQFYSDTLRSFGLALGIEIKELGVLGQAVYILDGSKNIRYMQIKESLEGPHDVFSLFKKIDSVRSNPDKNISTSNQNYCVPCEGGIEPLKNEEAAEKTKKLNSWKMHENSTISCHLEFDDFVSAMDFMRAVAVIAEDQQHHPDICISYNKMDITLTTHAAGGLTENDFIMAELINQLR